MEVNALPARTKGHAYFMHTFLTFTVKSILGFVMQASFPFCLQESRNKNLIVSQASLS